jgi:hypothetical protein
MKADMCPIILARVTFYDNASGHHVLRDARPGGAVDRDLSLLVHSAAIVADASPNGDLEGGIDTDRYGMLPARIEDFPFHFIRALFLAMKLRIEFPQRRYGKIDRAHAFYRSQK